jgi:hypothetical protein
MMNPNLRNIKMERTFRDVGRNTPENVPSFPSSLSLDLLVFRDGTRSNGVYSLAIDLINGAKNVENRTKF